MNQYEAHVKTNILTNLSMRMSVNVEAANDAPIIGARTSTHTSIRI